MHGSQRFRLLGTAMRLEIDPLNRIAWLEARELQKRLLEIEMQIAEEGEAAQ